MIDFKLSKINYKLLTIITIIILLLSCILIFYNVKAKQTAESVFLLLCIIVF